MLICPMGRIFIPGQAQYEAVPSPLTLILGRAEWLPAWLRTAGRRRHSGMHPQPPDSVPWAGPGETVESPGSWLHSPPTERGRENWAPLEQTTGSPEAQGCVLLSPASPCRAGYSGVQYPRLKPRLGPPRAHPTLWAPRSVFAQPTLGSSRRPHQCPIHGPHTVSHPGGPC